MPPEEEPQPPPTAKRGRIQGIFYDPLFGAYDRGYGGLGLTSFLLRIRYKKIADSTLQELDKSLLHKSVTDAF